jgi:putative transposase
MQLTHKIALKPTDSHVDYFKKAAGTNRFTWNWALGKWNELYLAGEKPNAMALKKMFNSIKYQEFPWLKEMHRDSHAQSFAYLDKAWKRFFKEIKSGKPAHEPLGLKREVVVGIRFILQMISFVWRVKRFVCLR